MKAAKKQTHPALWVSLMVIGGLAIVTGGIVAFTCGCNSGASKDGWCGVIIAHPPWTVISGLATIPALILTWIWREQHKRASEEHADAQIAVVQDGQVTERFTRAVEQLGSDKLPVRLGAIYALERIAKDSSCDHWTIMETLAAFIRASAPHPEFGRLIDAPFSNLDVRAALVVIGRRDTEKDPQGGGVDLSYTNLTGADLSSGNFALSNFRKSILAEAILMETDLHGSYFQGAIFRGAEIHSADMGNTWCEYADFSFAKMNHSSLERAYLDGAVLEGTDLTSADLTGAGPLYLEQLHSAIISPDTKLPDYLKEHLPPKPEDV